MSDTPLNSTPSILDLTELTLKALRELERRIDAIDKRLHSDPVFPEPAVFENYMTVRQYELIRELDLSIAEIQDLDRFANAFCHDFGIPMGRTWDDLLGEVNTYHFYALRDAFTDWLGIEEH